MSNLKVQHTALNRGCDDYLLTFVISIIVLLFLTARSIAKCHHPLSIEITGFIE